MLGLAFEHELEKSRDHLLLKKICFRHLRRGLQQSRMHVPRTSAGGKTLPPHSRVPVVLDRRSKIFGQVFFFRVDFERIGRRKSSTKMFEPPVGHFVRRRLRFEAGTENFEEEFVRSNCLFESSNSKDQFCLLYTSDAADE